MPAINRFDCPPSIGIGARHPSDYAHEPPTVVQFQPKRKARAKGGTNAAPTKISAANALLACMGMMNMRLSQLATLLACAETTLDKIESDMTDATLKNQLAIHRINKASNLIAVSVDLCDKSKSPYETCRELLEHVMTNLVTTI